jgi:hypothetical protein
MPLLMKPVALCTSGMKDARVRTSICISLSIDLGNAVVLVRRLDARALARMDERDCRQQHTLRLHHPGSFGPTIFR